MPPLDDTAVEAGLQRLPGWERCQIVLVSVGEMSSPTARTKGH
jgi:hypothetical protein